MEEGQKWWYSVPSAIIGRLLAAFKCAYKTSARIDWRELAKILKLFEERKKQKHPKCNSISHFFLDPIFILPSPYIVLSCFVALRGM
jgi:hypothetical protein